MQRKNGSKNKRWLKRDLFKLLRDIIMLALKHFLRFFFDR